MQKLHLNGKKIGSFAVKTLKFDSLTEHFLSHAWNGTCRWNQQYLYSIYFKPLISFLSIVTHSICYVQNTF